MSTKPSDPNDLFRKARIELSPTDADRTRNLGGLMIKVAAAGAVTTAATSASAAATSISTAAAVKSALFAKLGTAALALALGVPVAMGIHSITTPRAATQRAPTPSPSSSSARTTVAPRAAEFSDPRVVIEALPTPPVSITATPTRASAARPSALKPAPPPSSDSVEVHREAAVVPKVATEELALLERLHAAERLGDSAAVLAIAREHEIAFSAGTFVEEREAARAVARCARERADSGVATRFTDRFPRSPHRARIEAACANPDLE